MLKISDWIKVRILMSFPSSKTSSRKQTNKQKKPKKPSDKFHSLVWLSKPFTTWLQPTNWISSHSSLPDKPLVLVQLVSSPSAELQLLGIISDVLLEGPSPSSPNFAHLQGLLTVQKASPGQLGPEGSSPTSGRPKLSLSITLVYILCSPDIVICMFTCLITSPHLDYKWPP